MVRFASAAGSSYRDAPFGRRSNACHRTARADQRGHSPPSPGRAPTASASLPHPGPPSVASARVVPPGPGIPDPSLPAVRLPTVHPTVLFPSLLAVVVAVGSSLAPTAAHAYVALMTGQRARPLNGTFNNVPVLHSNQPEEVEGPGILISTMPGVAFAAEIGQPLRNAEYTFNGEFGLHVHHKYFPPNRASISAAERRSELTLATILINPGLRPVHIRFANGAVRNSFEAPYLANNLMGVKPLGVRPWNTGPGDATAVQMLRGKLDNRLSDEITIAPRSRLVLFQTALPALGIANALLRGRSDGPFQMAVVAAKNPQSTDDILAVLDNGRLAPGRVYLNRIAEINNRRIFSRVGGVALGDTYQASINHDLTSQGALHVPFTSTHRHEFGTRDVQVNPLASRMLDSSLDNVGTYGVRFDIHLNLRGNGPYELVMSHPSPSGGRDFVAFRGSIQIESEEGLREVHVGLRSGQSLSLAQLNLVPGRNYPVRVSMVYPADATPGHLLSVVTASQLAQVQEQERRLALARSSTPPRPSAPPPQLPGPVAAPPRLPPPLLGPASTPAPSPYGLPLRPPSGLVQPRTPSWLSPPPPAPRSADPLIDRYRQAVDAQRRMMQGWNQP
jgi:hypothetical protein